mmetsp:Transcript_10533/g.20807  ORF Transcript_10533/g.20807 Transcript_10533/m.20807 type:complete len:796 (+) Transcript_10533:136-2523(+)|eukprot:CAMPEP_0118802704 /NCGR_PEP_ID=MMETSP1161-20130426/10918_1 /TAXON_ID=249345 /ORGANISM="Picochlorum oklahomensis, Strain CCMP2329" /LENGTH=795 /DNA_ID=CAMNT_0006731027 /DNA_START=123 /DNA_END=2510 /DNA_ORIENTATION=-
MSSNDANHKRGEGPVGSRLYPLLFKANTTGQFRNICSRLSSDSPRETETLSVGRSKEELPGECPVRRKDLLCKILGVQDEYEIDDRKAEVLTKILMYPIIFCDCAPHTIINHPNMRKHVWEMIGYSRELDTSVLFGEFLNAQYAAFQQSRQHGISKVKKAQISVNLKSFKNADKTAKYVMANTLRLHDGQAVFCCIDEGEKSHDERSTMINQLQSMVKCIKSAGVAEKVNGFVINSSSCVALCRHVEDADPSTIAFPCQLYGLKKLLKSIIQKDIRLQETLQECSKLFEVAKARGYCSSETIERIDSWINIIRRDDPRATHTLLLCPYILTVDKLSNQLRGIQSDSSDIGMDMNPAGAADVDHTWEQISKYSKLLEPFIYILTSLETESPTLGQIYLMWSCLTRHASVWCELLNKSDEFIPYNTQCTSQRTIEEHVAQFKSSYYHPVFTLGYVLDCRLWTISHGTARPNTASLSIHEIGSAKELASSLARTQDAAYELKKLVDFGIPAYCVEDVRNVAGDVHCGCVISSDSDPDEIAAVLSFWRDVSKDFPNLSSIAESLLMMRGTCEKSTSIPSVTRWLTKSRESSSFPHDTAQKMAELALYYRLRDNHDTDCSTEQSMKTNHASISHYFGLNTHETSDMMHRIRTRPTAAGDASNPSVYKTPPRTQLLSRAPQPNNSLSTPHQDGLSLGLLQLTDQRLQSDWNFGEALDETLYPSIMQAKGAIHEDLKEKEKKSKEEESTRHIVQKRLVDHFPKHKTDDVKSTPATAPLSPLLESPNSARKKQRKALHPRSAV